MFYRIEMNVIQVRFEVVFIFNRVLPNVLPQLDVEL